ncbi:MAG: helix-turn-helix domain-containing protein [Clostridia bacterium]|nr:helix-turn-helix domain-containing protein [Clostridia bacterium]
MYTMIVVDDESEIRHGFCNFVPWSDIGFSIVADFSGAQEADDYLSRHAVDVIVMDIRMIGMSGLELIEIEAARHPETCLIVLSGYRDFDYAQRAMRFGVRYYLVKPVKYAQIMEVFTEIRHELDERRAGPAARPESADSIAESENENPNIRKIREYIHAHIRDVTLDGTAQFVRMNPYYLSTFFHRCTGEKFIDYLVHVRMKEAARLLTTTNMRIQDIAHQVGYSTPNSFARSFRLIYGITPREYRHNGVKESP